MMHKGEMFWGRGPLGDDPLTLQPYGRHPAAAWGPYLMTSTMGDSKKCHKMPLLVITLKRLHVVSILPFLCCYDM